MGPYGAPRSAMPCAELPSSAKNAAPLHNLRVRTQTGDGVVRRRRGVDESSTRSPPTPTPTASTRPTCERSSPSRSPPRRDRVQPLRPVEVRSFHRTDHCARPVGVPVSHRRIQQDDGREIALQWNSLHSPGCVNDLASAIDAVVAQRQLDGLYQHALSSATRSYCLT